MITVSTTTTREELETSVSEDLAAFDAWFQSLGNDPLVRSEVAILKTYLYFKLKGQESPST